MSTIERRIDGLMKQVAEHSRKTICAIHGKEYNESDLCHIGEWKGQCPECKREAEAKAAAEKQEQQRQRRVKASGLPSRFIDRNFENYTIRSTEQKNALGMVENYANDFDKLGRGRCLILSGSVGVGKTHLAAAIINTVIRADNDIDAVYTTARDMIRDIRSTWGSSSRNEMTTINHYATTGMLVIDEVGVQYGTESELILMFDVLDKRYGNQLPTVLISNLSLVELLALLGDRITDRLREDDGVSVVMNWKSNRGSV